MKPQIIENTSSRLLFGIQNLIEQKGRIVAFYLNTEISRLYWSIGNYIVTEVQHETYAQYGRQILATLSQTLSWSHFVELVSIDDTTKRFFYQQMCLTEFWSIRALRQKEDAIVSQLEDFILELGQGFAFLERQKRISIDSIDYYLDMLFYHRKLNRLIAIDLKLGKFKPEYKGQMELYLKYLQKYDKQPHENTPIGLLLCSEGNTEHVEILLLGEENIKVAQYLTALPDKQWFIEKLNKAITVAQQNAKLD